MFKDVVIPDIGDAEDVEVIEVLVAVGDDVGTDDALIVIESDKASLEVPSPLAGRIESIEVGLGDMVTEGQLIVRLATDAEVAADPEPQADADGQTATPATEPPQRADDPDPDEPDIAQSDANPESISIEASAPQRFEVRIPDIGDAEGVEVIEVAVAPGDSVAVDDLLVVIESDKASMEIPSPAQGTVLEIPVALGAEVAEGSLLVVLETNQPIAEADEPPVDASDELPVDSSVDKSEATPAPTAPGTSGAQTSDPSASPVAPGPAQEPATQVETDASVYAGPAVRRLARELGVNLTRVKGSGARGRIVKDDVHAFVKTALSGPVGDSEVPGSGGIPALPSIDFSRFGHVDHVELSRIRARGAQNLRRSWLNVPHVTQHDEADVTDLETFRKSLKGQAEARGVKLTPVAFIIRALVHVLGDHPSFNASLTADGAAMVLKRYYHIGFAVDTDEGLVVPVIRDADQLGVFELASRVTELSDKARAGRLGIDELSGGSFSISSLGAIGGTAFTPIVNAPEVAILGVSRLAVQPRWNGEEFAPRQMLPLSLSYDHRAINGAEAGRFMVALCEVLGDIRHMVL